MQLLGLRLQTLTELTEGRLDAACMFPLIVSSNMMCG